MTRSIPGALVGLFSVALIAPAVQADATLTMEDVGGKKYGQSSIPFEIAK